MKTVITGTLGAKRNKMKRMKNCELGEHLCTESSFHNFAVFVSSTLISGMNLYTHSKLDREINLLRLRSEEVLGNTFCELASSHK